MTYSNSCRVVWAATDPPPPLAVHHTLRHPQPPAICASDTPREPATSALLLPLVATTDAPTGCGWRCRWVPYNSAMRVNPGVELRDNAGQLELVITRRVDGPREYETRYDDRVKIALAHAHLVADEDLLRAGPQWIADRLVDRFGAKPVNCYLGGIRAERIAMHGRSGEEHVTPQILFRLSVPATGAIAAASISSQSGPDGAFLLQDVVATDADLGPAMKAGFLAHANNAFLERLTQAVEAADAAISEHRQHMYDELVAALTPRFDSVKALHKAAATLGIPIGARTALERIPLQLRTITMTGVAATPTEQQWRLDQAMAEDIMTTVMSFSTALERLPTSAAKLMHEDEETIRDILLFVLNANYRGTVTGETFRGAGKTDLLLRWQDRDAFIAECKFWSGSARFKEAVDQLLSYSVWRDTTIALILFLRDIADTSAIIKKAAAVITAHPRFVTTTNDSADLLRRQDFTMHASGDPERLVRLALLPVVITRPAHPSS